MFDIFFPQKRKRTLNREKLGKLLKEISELSPEEQEYVEAAFTRFETNGISRVEAEEVIKNLTFNVRDNLDAADVEKIKLKILSFFV